MSAAAAARLLTRQSHRRRGAPPLAFLGDLALDRGRAHEFCGPSRRVLALTAARALSGPVMWIRPAWDAGRLNPDGMLRFLDPSRLLLVAPKRPEDVLWTAEETLRSGALPLVIADLPAPPGLTAVRRLHLAAEAGGGGGLGLLLTPGQGGAPGVESRWALRPRHGAGGAEAWRLERLRARTAPERSWAVAGGPKGLTLVGRAGDETCDQGGGEGG